MSRIKWLKGSSKTSYVRMSRGLAENVDDEKISSVRTEQ